MNLRPESASFTPRDLYDYYQEGLLVKPRMQRKKRWVMRDDSKKNNSYFSYIEFMCKIGHAIIPLVFIEKLDNGVVKFIVLDGNNRIGAIIEFMKTPFKILGYKLDPKLLALSYDEIRTSKYKALCKKLGIVYDENFEEEVWDVKCAELARSNFDTISIPVMKLKNGVSPEVINFLYESINIGSTKLTQQEILASTTCNNTYGEHDTSFYKKMIKYLNVYYDEVNKKEVLKYSVSCQLSLFEVLISLQEYLSRYNFMPKPNTQDVQFDVIFECYKKLGYKFEERVNVDKFILKICKACKVIKSVCKSMKLDVNFKSSLSSLIVYSITSKPCDVYKAIYYHELLVCLKSRKIERLDVFKSMDPFVQKKEIKLPSKEVIIDLTEMAIKYSYSKWGKGQKPWGIKHALTSYYKLILKVGGHVLPNDFVLSTSSKRVSDVDFFRFGNLVTLGDTRDCLVDGVVDEVKYNSVCDDREELFLERVWLSLNGYK